MSITFENHTGFLGETGLSLKHFKEFTFLPDGTKNVLREYTSLLTRVIVRFKIDWQNMNEDLLLFTDFPLSPKISSTKQGITLRMSYSCLKCPD